MGFAVSWRVPRLADPFCFCSRINVAKANDLGRSFPDGVATSCGNRTSHGILGGFPGCECGKQTIRFLFLILCAGAVRNIDRARTDTEGGNTTSCSQQRQSPTNQVEETQHRQ